VRADDCRDPPGSRSTDEAQSSLTGMSSNEISGFVHGPTLQAHDIHGGVHVTVQPSTGSKSVTPAQLPPAPANFCGREPELTVLGEMVAGCDPIRRLALTVITGMGGTGKTALATYWLHRQAGPQPTAVLYADLRGHDPKSAVPPDAVLPGFLRALGAAPENIPTAVSEQAALFRSLTNGTHLLMLLDNAISAAQVRALLPGPGGERGPSVVVVTSRWRITGLAMDGARMIDLGPLDEVSAATLLKRMTGAERAAAEPDAVRDVVRLCSGLPLALSIAGAQLAMHPRWPVRRIATELVGERDRLNALSIPGDASITATFDLSYRSLPFEVARVCGLLSALFTPDFTVELAAAYADVIDIAPLIQTLADASLLEETADGRFQFHQLVRLHARRGAETDPAATARAIDWFLREAVAADLVISPGRWRLNPMYNDVERPRHEAPADALSWLESEIPGLVAAVHAAHDDGRHERAWQLCEALWSLFLRRKHFREWVDTHRTGLASAIACANRPAEARMRVQLGLAHLTLGLPEAADEEFGRSLDAARRVGHRLGEATALEHLGIVRLAMGHPATAIRRFNDALEIFREVDRPRGVLIMTRRLGEAHRQTGQLEHAVSRLREAHEIATTLGDRFGEARCLTSLGQTYLRAGKPEAASAALEEALEIVTEAGGRYEQARILASLADTALALGHTAVARAHATASHTIYSDLGAPEAEAVGQLIATLYTERAGVSHPAQPGSDVNRTRTESSQRTADRQPPVQEDRDDQGV
jgi:tetratricopeptide (TPR) repeat protein